MTDFEDDNLEISSSAVAALGNSSLAVSLSRAEIDVQIATAHAYPRSIERATKSILSLATLDEQTAAECNYALPRGGKAILGPSIRLAEIVQQCWGNNRVAARVVHVDRDERFVEAEGVYHDLQTNSASLARTRRRIVDKYGKIYNDDMIIMTGNAAASISKRNAIFSGVPKPVWRQAYEQSRKIVAGDIKTLTNRRAEALKAFAHYGVALEQIFLALEVGGEDDIDLNGLVVLRGMFSALRNGEETVETMFPSKTAARTATMGGAKTQGEALAAKLQARGDKTAAGFNEAHVRQQLNGESTDAKPGETAAPLVAEIDAAVLIADAHQKALQGRRAFDPWYSALSLDQQGVLASHMPALMKAANSSIQHAATTQAANVIEHDDAIISGSSNEGEKINKAPVAEGFDFDVELDAFEKKLAAISGKAELLAFGEAVQKGGWYPAATDELRDHAQTLFQDRVAELEKAEAKAKRGSGKAGPVETIAQTGVADESDLTPPFDADAPSEAESEADRLLSEARAVATNGVRKLKFWFGKLTAPQFALVEPHKASLEQAARLADEAL